MQKIEEIQTIKLAFYQEEYKVALYNFFLSEEKKQFTGLPNEVLEQAIADHTQYPIVILSDETPVGFFILHRRADIADFTDHPNALLLRAFSIDEAHQGKGYAKKGLGILPAFIQEHLPECEEVVLAVNARNLAAKQLYEKVGFADRGRRREGPIGPQYVMHLTIG